MEICTFLLAVLIHFIINLCLFKNFRANCHPAQSDSNNTELFTVYLFLLPLYIHS